MPQLDLQFRPACYWDHAGPVAAIVSGIKGQNRREMARDFVTGQAPDWLGDIDPGLLDQALDDETRDAEVEIARIVLASVTQDVFSFRARRRRGGRRILYRVVDEYHEPGQPGWTCRPASSARPLTLGQVIGLFDGARSPNFDLGDGPLTDLFRDFQEGSGPEDVVDFVSVESDYYPGLAEYFERGAAEWLERKRQELGDEDDGDGDANA